MEKEIVMYQNCPRCGASGRSLLLLDKKQAEELLKKEIPYANILLCPNGCRYTVVDRWNT